VSSGRSCCPQLVKKFLPFLWNPSVRYLFTRAPHWAPFFCKWIQSVSHLKYSSIYLEGVRVPTLFTVGHRIKWAPGTPAPWVTRPVGDLFSAKVKNDWSCTSTPHTSRHAYRRLSVPLFYIETFKVSAWFTFPHEPPPPPAAHSCHMPRPSHPPGFVYFKRLKRNMIYDRSVMSVLLAALQHQICVCIRYVVQGIWIGKCVKAVAVFCAWRNAIELASVTSWRIVFPWIMSALRRERL